LAVTDVRVAIVGGGITGLAAAAWLELDHGIDDVAVLEASARAGGKVRTTVEDGHTLEWGPQGFLDNAPDTIELVRRVGLGDETVTADGAAADRFILRGGRLRRVPDSPIAFLTSDVLPLGGRLRVLGEPFAPKAPGGDETVFDFARRRIGTTAAEVLVDAMVTGVFAGDSRQLSLAATFPRMAAMEAEHGSLTRALVARVWRARREGRRGGGPAGPGGALTSLHGGMERLPAAISDRLGHRLRLSSPVETVESRGPGYGLLGPSAELTAEAILLTTPAADSARLLERLAPAAVDPLREMRTAPIAVVMTSYGNEGAFGRPLRGFGFLVPGCEPTPILGSLFCHAIFPGQSPPGRVFLRTMVGGARAPASVELGDDELVGHVRRALADVLGADPEPERTWIVRWPEGISQYTVGHLDRVERIERTARDAGIEVAGSTIRGVSVNDCIRQARMAAHRIAQRLTRRQ
jgi:oxygen-dependent protoporphyrinogen oxidase